MRGWYGTCLLLHFRQHFNCPVCGNLFPYLMYDLECLNTDACLHSLTICFALKFLRSIRTEMIPIRLRTKMGDGRSSQVSSKDKPLIGQSKQASTNRNLLIGRSKQASIKGNPPLSSSALLCSPPPLLPSIPMLLSATQMEQIILLFLKHLQNPPWMSLSHWTNPARTN